MEWIKSSEKLPHLRTFIDEDLDKYKSINVLCSNGLDIWMGFYTYNNDGSYPLTKDDLRIGKKGWWTGSGYSCCSFINDEDYIWWSIPSYPILTDDNLIEV